MATPEIDKELDINTYEDIRVLGEVWQRKEIDAIELRTTVSTIRRLVIHNDLARCASPRRHKIVYDVPQNTPFIHACQNDVLVFWQSGGAAVFGTHMRCAALSNPRAPAKAARAHERKLKHYSPFSTVPMSRDNFLKQKVLFLNGTFMTRKQVLSFAANKAGDAHYDKNRDGIDETIDRVRSVACYELKGGDTSSFAVRIDKINDPTPAFSFGKNRIDPVLYEVAAAAKAICESRSIIELMAMIQEAHGVTE